MRRSNNSHGAAGAVRSLFCCPVTPAPGKLVETAKPTILPLLRVSRRGQILFAVVFIMSKVSFLLGRIGLLSLLASLPVYAQYSKPVCSNGTNTTTISGV